jgi:hypothetical protein
VKIGTIVWKWNDDQGRHHKFVIPKLFYVPHGNVRLLSPQHWAQTQKDRRPMQGTGSETLDNRVTLFWNQRMCKRTVHLGKSDNVATFSLADGFERFPAFCAKAEADYGNEQVDPVICQPAQTVSDDEESDDESEDKENESEDSNDNGKVGRSSN